uniref:Acetyl-CoA carboxylase n=1 Tax=Steinernema glaseri TaxID=37863 RepID=A0A1I7ZJC0_9BILA
MASSPQVLQTYTVSQRDGSHFDPDRKPYESVEEFVCTLVPDESKRRFVKKILVATNGIAALKCILYTRKFVQDKFGNDRLIKFISLTTEQEIQSNAEYLKRVDGFAISPAGANTNNYANVDEIVRHAVEQKVDAVWAGWGHASENPRLPKELKDHNIVFMGPPSTAMFALGDKIASTIIAQTVNIPTIEWSGSGLMVPEDFDATSTTIISDELYRQACVESDEEGLRVLREKNITYPVMIKASEGGGGKGIRKCNSDEEFKINFRRAEVPGSPIFLMKCMVNARHIEVQLIGDEYGTVIPIFTRDCSIQRRCQKIIEEAPAGIVPQHVMKTMQQDAVNLAVKVGYVSAGTVEYMYLPEEEKYYFLELNPRLQVEHPCTEMVAEINIPAIQMQIAMGMPLHAIDEIRSFFSLKAEDKCLPADLIRTDADKCVIAARITSEDPAEGFRPASGSIENLQFQSNDEVWGYFSVSSSGKVHEYADSQFGHLFARGNNRRKAVSNLICALKELELRATFTSQVNYLIGLLQDPEFEKNKFHTGWLDERIVAKILTMPELSTHINIAIGATVIGHARFSEVFSKFRSSIDRGQILPTTDLADSWQTELVYKNQKYDVLINWYGRINFMVSMNGSEAHTTVRELSNGQLLVTYGDQSYACHFEEEAERYKVTIGNTLAIFEKENDPSILRSRNAGKLLQFAIKDGETVEVGDIYAEMESMKMVIPLEVEKAGGRIVHRVRPGQALFPGTVIAMLEDQPDTALLKPVPFTGRITQWDDDEKHRQIKEQQIGLHVQFKKFVDGCMDILNGYVLPGVLFRSELEKFLSILDNRDLPYNLFKADMTVIESRLNLIVKEAIRKSLAESKEFPAQKLQQIIEQHLLTVDPKNVAVERTYFEALLKTCDRFHHGLEGHKKLVVEDLLKTFIRTEKFFQDKSYDMGLSELKKEVADSGEVVRMVYSHTRIDSKAEMLKHLLERLDESTILALREPLITISNFFNKECEKISIFVRTLLNRQHIITLEEKFSQMMNNSNYSLDHPSDSVDVFKHFNANNIEAIQQFLFTEDDNTNYSALAKIAEIISCAEAQQVKQIMVGPAALVAKVELLPNDPMARVLGNCGERHDVSSVRVLFFVAVNRPQEFASEVVPVLSQVEPGCEPMFFFVVCPENVPELKRSLEGILPVSDINRMMIVNKDASPTFVSANYFTSYKLEHFRLSDDCKYLSGTDSIYHLFVDQNAAVPQVFVRHLLVPQKNSSVNQFCANLATAVEGACGEMRVFIKTYRKLNLTQSDCNHIFICVDYANSQNVDIADVKNVLRTRCDRILRKHRVSRVEVSYRSRHQGYDHFVRVTYTNETGGVAVVSAYHIENGSEKDVLIPYSNAPYHCYARSDAFEPHTLIVQSDVQKKRLIARNIGTTYVYDFPTLFGTAVIDLWLAEKLNNPELFKKRVNLLDYARFNALQADNGNQFVEAHELIMEPNGELRVCRDEAELKKRASTGSNRCGQVAWEMKLFTPDKPDGRTLVVIASDITFRSGSYSMAEHNLYTKASEYSRKIKCPRVFIAASSGARIGLASQVQKEIHIKWRDDEPENGYEYLYVNRESPVSDQIAFTEVDDHLKIDAVIGVENDIGTENLVGSGLTAGETNQAYKEVPTFAIVTGRAVGIAAYNARLCKRICQVGNSPLILTGAPALNSLLGKEVYTSNQQLGGPQIMHPNGVSHSIVNTDADGVAKIVRWLSYTLPDQATVISSAEIADNRDVEYSASRGPSDPRLMLDQGDGIFDKNSFDEIMSGWAKTIITGRAHLFGLPVGVISVETRTVEAVIPADPATPDSQAKTVLQAGQVWYPDSAYKTAEAINDFNKEGLPLVILANIRGFSGGQKDMFDMVLKFGAEIVAALQAYVQPVVVYIPPFGELRGGAWAVLDTKINSTCIKMIADPDSRGGILEPEGIVEIKFRSRQLEELISREDKEVNTLQQLLSTATEIEKIPLQKKIAQRVEYLKPLYRPAAVQFADLHDRTPRMLAKGSLHDVVPLRKARQYIHSLLIVEMTKMSMAKRYLDADGRTDGPVNICNLKIGYEWVEKHLTEKSIACVEKRIDGSEQIMRYQYTGKELLQYEQSAEFAEVLKGVRDARLLDSISKLSPSDVLSRLISNVGEAELHRLLPQLGNLSF